MLTSNPRVALLEQTHPEYDYYRETWQTIQDIRNGAIAIRKKIRTYLPQRPDEAEDIYQLRLNKAAWTPVMSTAIREFIVKMLASPMHVEGTQGEFWQAFRDDTNGQGRDESDLLTSIFSSLLYYGRIYVAVDRAVLAVTPRSAFEETLVKALPKVVLYEPLAVTNYGDGWLQTKEVTTVTKPLQKPMTVVTWRIWTDTVVNTYQAEVILNDQGAIASVFKDALIYPLGSSEATATLVSTVKHQLGTMPIVKAELPAELWTGNNCYLKQLQHFAIESSWTDAGMMAGTIQRVFTPTPPVASADPSVVFDEPDYSSLKSDNAHVLIGNGFQFVESSGSAIASLTTQLETIANQIRAIVSMTSNTVDASVQAQSGASKAIDREPLEATMKAYGIRIASFYQDILQLVAKAANKDTAIAVNGLDSYSVETLSDMLAQTLQMTGIYQALPPTALKLWFGKLANLIAGSRSANVDNGMNQQLDSIWSAGLPQELLPPEPTETVNQK